MADPGIDALLRLLYATLDATPGVRQQGEAGLAAAACQPGFGLALAHVAVAQDLPYGIKQLAAVVLKQYVKVRRRVEAFRGLRVRLRRALAPACAAARGSLPSRAVALCRRALAARRSCSQRLGGRRRSTDTRLR